MPLDVYSTAFAVERERFESGAQNMLSFDLGLSQDNHSTGDQTRNDA
jgi:hypothetical protein